MSKQVPIAIAKAVAPTASTNGSGVEISDYTGNAQLVMNAATPAAGQTLDMKLQHSRDDGSTDAYADAGIAFAQVTNALANGFQTQTISVDGLKKYVRAVSTIAGGATALPYSVSLVGNKAF